MAYNARTNPRRLDSVDGAAEMTTRIAVHALVDPSWGGSFQYAESIIDGLVTLPKDQFETRVWYRNQAWEPILAAKGIGGHRFDPLARPSLWERLIAPVMRTNAARSVAPGLAETILTKMSVTTAMERWGADVCFNLQQSWLEFKAPLAQIAPVHDLMHIYEPDFPEVKGEYEARQWLYGNIARHARVILCESEVGKQQLIESFQADPDHVVVLPLISPKSLPAAIPSRPKNLSENVGTGDFVFYPAQFWQHKNHVRLLEAMAQCASDNVQCVFTGGTDKNGYPAAAAAIERLGLDKRVHILGYVEEPELAWLYRNARMLVMPTFFGPTNIPPLEAMSLGCPVAVSDIFGMAEHYGEAALTFDPRNVSDIARVIDALWNDNMLRERLVASGHAFVEQWTPDDFEQRVADIVSRLAGK